MGHKLDDRIAATYYGCKISHPTYGIGVICGILHRNIYLLKGQHGPVEGCDIDKCQLMLTPLSKITDEDASKIIHIIWNNSTFHRPTNGKYIAENLRTVDLPIKVGQIIAEYLRSPFRADGTSKPVYDLGFGPIESLIEAGIAIDVTNGELV